MNEKTYHISPKKLAEAQGFTARIYPESVLKAVWRRIRELSQKTILKLLSVPVLAKLSQAATRSRRNTSDTNTTKERATDFAVLRAAQLTLSHGYRYFGIINEAAGYAITNANAYASGDMAFGNSYTTCVPGLSIPIFKREPGLMIYCFDERPAGGFALDAQFISYSIRTKYDLSSPRTTLNHHDGASSSAEVCAGLVQS